MNRFFPSPNTKLEPPAIVLINPKYGRNVASAIRVASAYGIQTVIFTGNRVQLELENKKRLPREERMKGYREVAVYNYDYPLNCFDKIIPVALELLPNAEPLTFFQHPQNCVYVFGPEDGSITSPILRMCHRFIYIPTRHCLNLATAIATVMYDRECKENINGKNLLKLAEARGMANDLNLYGLEDV